MEFALNHRRKSAAIVLANIFVVILLSRSLGATQTSLLARYGRRFADEIFSSVNCLRCPRVGRRMNVHQARL